MLGNIHFLYFVLQSLVRRRFGVFGGRKGSSETLSWRWVYRLGFGIKLVPRMHDVSFTGVGLGLGFKVDSSEPPKEEEALKTRRLRRSMGGG